MKELWRSLAQLVAIIMILLTFAISSAVISQWTNAGTENTTTANQAPSSLVYDAGR
jgi:hypothetical protein